MNARLIVLDTNCLVQALPSKSRYHKIWTHFIGGRYFLCVSNEILNEYEEIIARLSSPTVAKNVIDAIVHSPYTLYKEVYYRFNLIEVDTDDNKFVDCAIASGAYYIVTEDKHFDILKAIPFPHIEVVGIDTFLASLGE